MKQILIAIDRLFNYLLGGSESETISSRAWRQQDKLHWFVIGILIDGLFFWEQDHCRKSYESIRKRGD